MRQGVDSGLVTLFDAGGEAAEAFRVIRTNLRFSPAVSPLKTLLVTSAGRCEGKTLTTANLAVAFAQDGAHVLSVDANLRHPGLGAVFGLPQVSAGLSDVLQGTHHLQDVVQAGPVERLSILTSGPVPGNPAELLGSARMCAFLSETRQAYDLVVLDSPPALGVSDTVVLAPKVDGVLLAIRSGMTLHPKGIQASDALRNVGANVLGAVLLQ